MRRSVLLVSVAAAVCAGAGAHALEVGQEAPRLQFEDIQGRKAATGDYPGWTVVYTFADRGSNASLTEWIYEAGKEIARRDPGRKIAYINFADVHAVPKFVRVVVNPMLRRIDDKTRRETEASYRQGGMENISGRFAFHLVPDWDGTYLEAFGIPDAADYRIWIVDRGRVVAALDEAQKDVENRFLDAFDRLRTAAAARPADPAGAVGGTGP